MKKPKVFFPPIDGTASLSISWMTGSKRAATEALNEKGVGFFAEEGTLLGVVFDEIAAANDVQVLKLAQHRVTVTVKKSKVTHQVEIKKRGKAA